MIAGRRLAPFLVMAACAAALFPLQGWIDTRVPREPAAENTLYVAQGETLRRLAMGYDALLADIYWIRAVQFFGRTVLADHAVLADPRGRLDLLYPLLDVATTLGPRDVAPYRFGGYFVHDYVDKERGRALLEKGILHNPDNFRLYQDLAYLEWTDGDCAAASELYDRGSRATGAPTWMKEMSATVLAQCGQADVALDLLSHQYESTDDPRMREELGEQIKRYTALAEVTYLGEAAAAFRQQLGAPPVSLAQLVRAIEPRSGAPRLRLDANGAPVDPNGVPYAYDAATGEVKTAPNGVVLPAIVKR